MGYCTENWSQNPSSWTHLLFYFSLPDSFIHSSLLLRCLDGWKHHLSPLALQVATQKQRDQSHNESRNSQIQTLLMSLMSLPQRLCSHCGSECPNSVFPSVCGTDMRVLMNKETHRIWYYYCFWWIWPQKMTGWVTAVTTGRSGLSDFTKLQKIYILSL